MLDFLTTFDVHNKEPRRQCGLVKKYTNAHSFASANKMRAILRSSIENLQFKFLGARTDARRTNEVSLAESGTSQQPSGSGVLLLLLLSLLLVTKASEDDLQQR